MESQALVVGILCFLLVIQSLVFITLTSVWYAKRRDVKAQQQIQATQMCLKCSDLETNDAIDQKEFTMSPKCCESTTVVLDRLVKKEVNQKCKEAIFLDAQREVFQKTCTGTLKRTFGIVKGIRNYTKHESKNEFTLLWNVSDHSNKGILHLEKQGEILILTPGEYFLTVQLTFKGVQPLHKTHAKVEYHVTHISSNSSEERILLEDSRTNCVNETHFQFTSNMGTVLRLEEHDRLFVSTSLPHFVDKETEHCFLMLYHNYL